MADQRPQLPSSALSDDERQTRLARLSIRIIEASRRRLCQRLADRPSAMNDTEPFQELMFWSSRC
jgi:hypothetical protein